MIMAITLNQKAHVLYCGRVATTSMVETRLSRDASKRGDGSLSAASFCNTISAATCAAWAFGCCAINERISASLFEAYSDVQSATCFGNGSDKLGIMRPSRAGVPASWRGKRAQNNPINRPYQRQKLVDWHNDDPVPRCVLIAVEERELYESANIANPVNDPCDFLHACA